MSGEKPYYDRRVNTEQAGCISVFFLPRCDERDNFFFCGGVVHRHDYPDVPTQVCSLSVKEAWRAQIRRSQQSASSPHPAGVDVSIFVVMMQKSAPVFHTFSSVSNKSFREREIRPSFRTKTSASLRSFSKSRCNSGRSYRPPDIFSSNINSRPADFGVDS